MIWKAKSLTCSLFSPLDLANNSKHFVLALIVNLTFSTAIMSSYRQYKRSRYRLSEKMEGINIPADNVPEGLKACEQILKRAKEIKKVEPVVAYWCEFSPFLPLGNQNPSSLPSSHHLFLVAFKTPPVPFILRSG